MTSRHFLKTLSRYVAAGCLAGSGALGWAFNYDSGAHTAGVTSYGIAGAVQNAKSAKHEAHLMEVAKHTADLFYTEPTRANAGRIRYLDIQLMYAMYCAELEFMNSPEISKALQGNVTKSQSDYLIHSVIGRTLAKGSPGADALTSYRSYLLGLGLLDYSEEIVPPSQEGCDSVAYRYISLKRR